MKGVLAWVKGHLVVVISVVLALAALPVLLVVSNGMNTTLREDVESDISGKQRNLQQISVQYNVEPLDPTEVAEGFSATPNEATTNAVKAVIEAHDRDATRVLEAATARNRAGKTPMLDGLFPSPLSAETTAKRQGAARAWMEAHADVLRRVGAGGPVKQADMLVILQARATQETERMLTTLGVSELDDEQKAEVRKTLEALRLDRLRVRAGDVSFYATTDIFEGVEMPEGSGLPSLERIWDWQHRYWVHEDIVEAAAAANSDPLTGLVYRPGERPVRRLVTVRTTPWEYVADSASSEPAQEERRSTRRRRAEPEFPTGGGTSVAPLSSEIRADFEASLTGRAGWPYKANPLYDTRYVTVTAIVDGAGIDRFIDAIEADNFMTVVDLDLAAVSPIDGLSEGYFYGPGSLMRAEMVVETLWLREWVGEFAPDAVRERMGLPARPEPGSGNATTNEGDMQ